MGQYIITDSSNNKWRLEIKDKSIYKLIYYVCVHAPCIWGQCLTCMQRLEETCGVVLFFQFLLGSGDQTQVARFAQKAHRAISLPP